MSRGKQNTKSGWKKRDATYRDEQRQRRRKNAERKQMAAFFRALPLLLVPVPSPAQQYEGMTTTQLLEACKAKGLKATTKTRKPELVSMLVEASV